MTPPDQPTPTDTEQQPAPPAEPQALSSGPVRAPATEVTPFRVSWGRIGAVAIGAALGIHGDAHAAVGFQARFQASPDVRFIVDDQDGFHGIGILTVKTAPPSVCAFMIVYAAAVPDGGAVTSHPE